MRRTHAKYKRTLYPYVAGGFELLWSFHSLALNQLLHLIYYHIIYLLYGGYYNMDMSLTFSESVHPPTPSMIKGI